MLYLSMYGGHFAIEDVIVIVFDKLNYTMQMDARQRWMYGDRLSSEYRAGLDEFLGVAQAHKENGFMCCPCVDCRNVRERSSSRVLHGHLLRRGFMPSYNCWTKHGERGVVMEDNEEEEEDPMFPEYDDTAMEDNAEEGGDQERASDERE